MPHDDHLPPPAVDNSIDGDVSGKVVQIGSISHHHHHATPQGPQLPLRVGLVPLRAASFQQRGPGADLARALDGGDTAVLVADTATATVLSGMGGVGKTQLAADHAERAWANGEVQLLVWVTATSREAIVSGYADAAARLTGLTNLDPEHGARTLLEWLAANKSWLVVLDDLQTPADLARLWPPTTGQTVVTTRRRDAALRGHRRQLVEVGVFNEPEALAYMRTVLADQPRLLDGAEELVRDLGFLPVALAQAGAYMVDKHLSCAEYRARFAERRLAQVVPDLDGLPDEHRTTVAATWSLSVEQADRLAPEGVARPLLELASVLDSNGVPVSVFTAAATLKMVRAATGREVDASEARDGLGCLHRLNLITLNTDSVSREVRVHALVQRATRDAWPDDRTSSVVYAAAEALYEVWPDIERDTVLGQVLRTNVDALAEVDREELWRPRCHAVLLRAGRSRGATGLVAEAIDYLDALSETAIRLLGDDHHDTLLIRNNLAHWRAEAGDVKGAIAAFEALLADRTRILGPDHRSTLITRSNLASVQGDQGDHAAAAAAYEQLLADRIRILGPDHPDTLLTRNNLASERGELGDDAGALAAYEQLLLDHLRILGPDHPSTLLTRNNLARRRSATGDIAGAIAAYEQLLTDRTRVLGPDHPDTLLTRSNLISARRTAGDRADAIAVYEQLLADRTRVLGPDHPDTLVTRGSLASARMDAGDRAGATAAYEQLLADRTRVLGPDHPDPLVTRGSLASARMDAGDRAGATAAYEQLLADRTRVLGPDHPDTFVTRSNLASAQGRSGDPAGAVAANEQLLADRTRVLGPDHPSTVLTRDNLAYWKERTEDPSK
ncbi:tetratricopeptide repeat protein [Lentzea alba]|uniref:tetratricopeptide repeat protein n=1 Tax=Lentzea alba TaxID=2714351 RepID=UPI0039BEF14C